MLIPIYFTDMSIYIQTPPIIANESDVEQKIVFQLLTNLEPIGLGFSLKQVQTKLNLKKLRLDKGDNARNHYPDYLVLIEGLPLLVVEVKGPGTDLREAYREGRLYSGELNSLFPGKINPCQLVIACNDKTMFAGRWDSQAPDVTIDIENWNVSHNDFNWLLEKFAFSSVVKQVPLLKSKLNEDVHFTKPIIKLGGKHMQNRSVSNSFGETISIEYGNLFNPEDENERVDVVTNAYVHVEKQLAHVDPIEKLIRKKISPSVSRSNEIANNTKPVEIIDKLKTAHKYNNKVLLLIGSVGSGKSTFMTYLKEVALDPELSERLTWVRLDMNNAEVNQTDIYDWLKTSISRELVRKHPSVDVGELEIIKQIYSDEIEDFNKTAKLLIGNIDTYNLKLFDKIQQLKSDKNITLTAYINHFVHKAGKDLIIVLDNCDKKSPADQLLMFEVANWLKENTKSIVFLPIRDTTFDLHRHEKPLDTVIKDLIFRINPPSLERVLFERVKYASRLRENVNTGSYTLTDSMRVSHPSKEELHYLRSIMKSLFQNSLFKKLISGLAGRNVRRGIEIFLDFCKSGHISDGEILHIRLGKGEYVLPDHVINRVFLRGNRVYYSDTESRIKNLFYSEPKDDLPDPFVRISILKWLKDRNSIRGASNVLGFHKVTTLIDELVSSGHNKGRILEELKVLIKHDLVISETQSSDTIDEEELLSINASGFVHLKLIYEVDYWSACSEDVWYNQQGTATVVANRMGGIAKNTHLSFNATLENADALVNYLEGYYNANFKAPSAFMDDVNFESPINFSEIKDIIRAKKDSYLVTFSPKSIIGQVLDVEVKNIAQYGLICTLGDIPRPGLLHVSKIPNKYFLEEGTYELGKTLKLKVTGYSGKHKKFDLAFPD